MSNYDMSIHTNPDAKAWAEFFMKTKDEQQWSADDIDEDLMIGWFANAMMAMHDHLLNGKALVPLEPTREMVEALRDAISVTSRGGVLRAGIALKASIAAAQAQPE